MKKRIGILALVILAVLTLICANAAGEESEVTSFGEFTGNETVNAELRSTRSGMPFSFFSRLIYINSALPEGLKVYSPSENIYLSPLGPGNAALIPDAGELKFVSGDEALRDALYFLMQDDEVILKMRPDLDEAKPCEAVYHVRIKSSSLYYETEFVFRLLSWEECPLFEFVYPDRSGRARKGEGTELVDTSGNVLKDKRSSQNNSNLYSAEQIAGLLFRDHSTEIMTRLMTKEQLQVAAEIKQRQGFYNISAVQVNKGVYPQDNLWNGMVYERMYEADPTAFQFREAGEYTFDFSANISNIQGTEPFVIRVLPYRLTGPSTLMPGEAGTYLVTDEQPEEGRTFSLSAQGEGISFDAETGILTVAEDTPEGTEFTVTAAPSDNKGTITLEGKVSTGLISGEEFKLVTADGGFSIPLPADQDKYDYGQGACYTKDQNAPSITYIRYHVYSPLEEFAEDDLTADKYYGMTQLSNYPEYQEEDIILGDHHARVMVFRVDEQGTSYSGGTLLYVRNNRLMQIDIISLPQNGTAWEALPKVTMGDMRQLAEHIVYDPSAAAITVADGAISLSSGNGSDVVTAGKKMTVTATFANPGKVNKQEKNDIIEWSVTGADGAAAPAGVSINNKGELTTAKSDQVIKVEVKAVSPVFHTWATFPVTIIPEVKKIAVEPAELWFYTGTDDSAEVKAVLEPGSVPAQGISWEDAKKGIVEITANRDSGTAVIRPLAAGKTTVQVKEPGGKNAKLTVSVVDPVKELELTVKGTPKAGSTVTVQETILPKQAGNKTVEWTLDVGGDIATITKGKVKISKTAPEGTVITVTCTAVGAPEPVVKTVQITVTK